jgi:hypothetical protein
LRFDIFGKRSDDMTGWKEHMFKAELLAKIPIEQQQCPSSPVVLPKNKNNA